MLNSHGSIIAGSICAIFLGAGVVAAEPEKGAPAPAEEAGWELAFHDTFDRAELGPDWEVDQGDWSVEEGALRGSGVVMIRRSFAGDVPRVIRLELEVQTDVRPFLMIPGAPPPAVEVSDLSSMIHSNPRAGAGRSFWQTGYFFQFGGSMNRRNRITRDGVDLVRDNDPEVRITTDKKHRIVVENDDGHLRMFIDGALLMEHHDPNPFAAVEDEYDRVALFLFTRAKVHEVRVYTRPRGEQ